MQQTCPVRRCQVPSPALAVQLRYGPDRANVGGTCGQVVLLAPHATAAAAGGGRHPGTGAVAGTHHCDGVLVDGDFAGLFLQRALDGRRAVQIGHALADLGGVEFDGGRVAVGFVVGVPVGGCARRRRQAGRGRMA